MGFAIRLQPAQLADHVEAMRRQGFASYSVWPAGQRDEYTADVYIEPFAGSNLRAFGYDMFSEPAARAAMARARDSGKATVSSGSTLFQESGSDPHAGYLMYVPVYATGATPATVAERRLALRGYVFGAINGEEMVRSILSDWPPGIGCELYDGEQPSPSALRAAIPDAAQTGVAQTGAAQAGAVQAARAEVAAFNSTRKIEVAGHPWILRCRSGPYAQAVKDSSQPVIVLAAGIPISLLFFAIAWSQSTLRERAQALANEMTAKLRRNVAERQRLEASLRQAQKLEAMGTLAGGIAHDFNNILGAILGYGELAQNAAPAEGPLRRYVDNIMSAGLRAKSLVERILAFSRSGLGERVSVHAQSVVTEALDLVSGSLPPGVRLERDLHAGDAAIVGDPTQIHQVVMNLCTNALQAMKSGGVLTVCLDLLTLEESHTFATAALPAGGYVRLLVRDSGLGIDPEVLERIFDPFFTTKEVGVGTGLGLSLVHGIVRDLDGAVDVQSEPGRGSTFTVLLPRHGQASQTAHTAEESPHGAGETILLVDDEEPLVRVGEEMIAELGYEPVGFTSSTAALAAFRADPQRFAAVLSDEMMPEMTGSQLAREIRKLRPDVPIVLMSGYGGTSLAARAMGAGANEVLGKPLVARDIARALARVLSKSPAK
jgi:signal transduction histidine kinase/ActR/RegA family two-component response regulator